MPRRRKRTHVPAGRKAASGSRRAGGVTVNSNGESQRRTRLEQSEAQLRAVLETAVDAIITIDARGRIQSVNPATARMFGYTAREMIGRNVTMLMPSPYREEHDGYLARYLRTGEKRIIGIGREVEAQRKDGSVFAVDLAVSEVVPSRLFTGMIRDISDRKLVEARLREADRLASIGTLAAGLGHDMNNVLLPVRAHLNAASALAILPAVINHIKSVQKSIGYLQQLADGLHFLAMDPDSIDDTSGCTDLTTWWAQTGAILGKAVPKHVKVAVSIPSDLHAVRVAAHALTQAVLNLIVNAGEAIPPARKRRQGLVRLWAQPVKDNSSVKLGVTDNGTGMTDEVKRRAFDMFFTTKPRGLGTGLGLAMVRKVVDRAGGSVQIHSQPGKGTTVEMILPAAAAANGRRDPQIAAVRINDGRAASLIRNLLEASGISTTDGANLDGADLCVIEPSSATLSMVKAWQAARGHGRLVLVGRPSPKAASAWRALHPVIIEDPNDFQSVRGALGLVTSTS